MLKVFWRESLKDPEKNLEKIPVRIMKTIFQDLHKDPEKKSWKNPENGCKGSA